MRVAITALVAEIKKYQAIADEQTQQNASLEGEVRRLRGLLAEARHRIVSIHSTMVLQAEEFASLIALLREIEEGQPAP